MDNVTHTLFGLTLARTPLGRVGRGATLALVLASNAPDIDIVSTAGGALKYLEWHRGLTHGPIGVIGLSARTAALVAAVGRITHGRALPSSPPASFRALMSIAVVGVVCHVLMDLPTSYGVRLFAPLSWRWFTTDWMPIVDIYLLVALAAGWVLGRASEGARQRNVIIVFTLMVLLYGIRAVGHMEALQLASRAFGPHLASACGSAPTTSAVASWPAAQEPVLPEDASARCLIEVAAIPSFVSPFDWRLIAHFSNGYELQDVNLFERRLRDDGTGSVAPWRMSVRFPNLWSAEVFRASATPVAKVYLGFSRFPAARSVRTREGNSMVQWTDMRFLDVLGRPGGRQPRATLFTATVRFDSSGRIVDQRLGEP
jgi:inner membrane protein